MDREEALKELIEAARPFAEDGCGATWSQEDPSGCTCCRWTNVCGMVERFCDRCQRLREVLYALGALG